MGALHPLLVELRDAFVRLLEDLGEVCLHVLEDLVVESALRQWRTHAQVGNSLGEPQVLRVDLLEQVPVRLGCC